MHKLFSELVDKHTPKANPHVMNGLACLYMEKAEEYIDEVFKSVCRNKPKGLEYLGYEYCTPLEEYLETTKNRSNKRLYDLAKSDLYMVKYFFSFRGKPLPTKYLYLPYVHEGGILSLSGSLFHITPVLSDKVISPGTNSVFVRLLRDRLIFNRCLHPIIINGEREINYVVWSKIHQKKLDSKIPRTTRANSCIAHYLLGKYGFSEMFRKYCGFIPVVGGSDINEDVYSPEEWVICQSGSEIKPRSFMGDFYEQTDIRLAIPVEHWTELTKSLVSGFYYIVDHFPNRFKLKNVKFSIHDYIDNCDLWMTLLGHIISSGKYGENKLYNDVKEHYESINNCLDNIIIEKLKESGVVVSDFYDLLIVILSKFNSMVIDNENSSLSVYGKSLEILYHVLYDITSSMVKIVFNVTKKSNEKTLPGKGTVDGYNDTLQLKDVVETFKIMSTGKIYEIRKNNNILETVSYSGDHKYPKITSRISEQKTTPANSKSGSKHLTLGPDKHLHPSMIEAGSILFLSKSNPSVMNRLNPFVNIDLETATILPHEKHKDLLDKTYRMMTEPLNTKND